MPATIDCTTCATKLKVPENTDSQTFQCPKCGSLIEAQPQLPQRADSIQATPGASQLARNLDGDRATCPYCRENIQAGARKCKHCGELLDPELRDPIYTEDDRPPRLSAPAALPGKVQAVAIMMIIGGISGIMLGLGLALGTCFLWVPALYSIVCGILCIVRATPLLGDRAYTARPPRGTAVMMIVTIINGDVLNLTLGIVCLVFLNDPRVQEYFSRRRLAD
jgi:DNA-directed RNA polymerase subunit M/transcription elongation factor TFIIS